MEKKNYSQNNNVEIEQFIAESRSDKGNTVKQNQEKGDTTRTTEIRQTGLGK